MELVIDRFEEELAVCELDGAAFVTVPRARLPEGGREGDILHPLPDGGFRVDEDETAQRRRRNAARMRSLFDR